MSDSIIPPQSITPAVAQALSTALLQKLNTGLVGVSSPSTPIQQKQLHSVVNEIFVKLFSPQAANSPRSDVSTSTLSRTSSNCSDVGQSISRTSSNASNNSSLSDATNTSSASDGTNRSFDDGDDGVVFIKKRKASQAQFWSDSKVVTVPLLRVFDAKWLAPHPDRKDNPLFEFRVRAGIRYGGSTQKKYSDMVVPFFKKHARPIIRRLVTANLRMEQEQDPTMTYEKLRTRYSNAAIRVVRKRRANHVQSWRPDKRGTHLPLIVPSYTEGSFLRKPLARAPLVIGFLLRDELSGG